MHTVTESIYSGAVIVPLADVSHIEPWPKNTIPGIMVITKHTKWNFDRDLWENAIWISDPEAVQFRAAWCRYRSELEADTLANLAGPSEVDRLREGLDRIANPHILNEDPREIARMVLQSN